MCVWLCVNVCVCLCVDVCISLCECVRMAVCQRVCMALCQHMHVWVNGYGQCLPIKWDSNYWMFNLIFPIYSAYNFNQTKPYAFVCNLLRNPQRFVVNRIKMLVKALNLIFQSVHSFAPILCNFPVLISILLWLWYCFKPSFKQNGKSLLLFFRSTKRLYNITTTTTTITLELN